MSEVAALKKVTPVAERAGVVIEQNAYEGTYVNTGTPVFAIANPRFIWARLEAYESDYSWIRMGVIWIVLMPFNFCTTASNCSTVKGLVRYAFAPISRSS